MFRTTIERLLQHIYDEGFDIDQSHTEDEPEEEINGVCISMPRSIFTDSNLENLKAIVAAKGNLIKKALGTAGSRIIPQAHMQDKGGNSIHYETQKHHRNQGCHHPSQ